MGKEIIAMLLAGGQGSRLGVLTVNEAKPAVAFGGKYKIIDFPLSNCINSGIDTVGVLTQYQPLALNTHIGIGIPWDLDRNDGGVSILPPYESTGDSGWYSGTANAIYQNIRYIDAHNPEYVLILSGDHIYKMDYEAMLDFHKKNHSNITIATIRVPMEEASRFGIIETDSDFKITAFAEKPEVPKSNLASMGIYIFDWKTLRDSLVTLKDIPGCDFGKHILPHCLEKGDNLFAYEFSGYWKDVGTLSSYWEANMELIDLIPEFNLYEEYWKIYTNQKMMQPQYISAQAEISRAIISAGCTIEGKVIGSVLGSGVVVEEGAEVRDSIIMEDTVIKKGARIEKAIIAEHCEIGAGTVLGDGEEAESQLNSGIYNYGLVTVGEKSVIPDNVTIGKNTTIYGKTTEKDYKNGVLESGGYIVKDGDKV